VGYYDLFSSFYDASVERHYVELRPLAAQALELEPGMTVLDVPTGTGAMLPLLGDAGTVYGVDASAGMLKRAAAKDCANAALFHADVCALPAEIPQVDRILVFLGMSAFPDMQAAFDHLWDRLKAGGRMVIVDVYAEKLGFQGRMVNLTARAEIRRKSWEPLERVGLSFTKSDLPSTAAHGGQMFCATATKPA